METLYDYAAALELTTFLSADHAEAVDADDAVLELDPLGESPQRFAVLGRRALQNAIGDRPLGSRSPRRRHQACHQMRKVMNVLDDPIRSITFPYRRIDSHSLRITEIEAQSIATDERRRVEIAACVSAHLEQSIRVVEQEEPATASVEGRVDRVLERSRDPR